MSEAPISPLEKRIDIPLSKDHTYNENGQREIGIALKEVIDYINAHHETIELLEASRRLGKLGDLLDILKGSVK